MSERKLSVVQQVGSTLRMEYNEVSEYSKVMKARAGKTGLYIEATDILVVKSSLETLGWRRLTADYGGYQLTHERSKKVLWLSIYDETVIGINFSNFRSRFV